MIKIRGRKRSFYFAVVIIVLLIVGAITSLILKFSSEDSWICENGTWIKHGNPSIEMPIGGCGEKPIGGDKDEHGCLIAAGYSWNETKQKCVREWEEKLKVYCTAKSRGGDVCTMDYTPVCGYFDSSIQCIKYPCAQTYGNACGACHDSKVEYYINGECPTN